MKQVLVAIWCCFIATQSTAQTYHWDPAPTMIQGALIMDNSTVNGTVRVAEHGYQSEFRVDGAFDTDNFAEMVNGPSADTIKYTWTATGGTFTSTNTQYTVWTAPTSQAAIV